MGFERLADCACFVLAGVLIVYNTKETLIMMKGKANLRHIRQSRKLPEDIVALSVFPALTDLKRE